MSEGCAVKEMQINRQSNKLQSDLLEIGSWRNITLSVFCILLRQWWETQFFSPTGVHVSRTLKKIWVLSLLSDWVSHLNRAGIRAPPTTRGASGAKWWRGYSERLGDFGFVRSQLSLMAGRERGSWFKTSPVACLTGLLTPSTPQMSKKYSFRISTDAFYTVVMHFTLCFFHTLLTFFLLCLYLSLYCCVSSITRSTELNFVA